MLEINIQRVAGLFQQDRFVPLGAVVVGLQSQVGECGQGSLPTEQQIGARKVGVAVRYVAKAGRKQTEFFVGLPFGTAVGIALYGQGIMGAQSTVETEPTAKGVPVIGRLATVLGVETIPVKVFEISPVVAIAAQRITVAKGSEAPFFTAIAAFK